MIIDVILNRLDGEEYSREMLGTIREHAERFCYCDIAVAIDTKDSKALTKALCAYIDGEYNPDIKAYVRSVDWLDTHTPTITERMNALEHEYDLLEWEDEFRHDNDPDEKRKKERMKEINYEYTDLARQNPRVFSKVREIYKFDPEFVGEVIHYLIKPYHKNRKKFIEHPTFVVPNFWTRDKYDHVISANPKA